MKKNYNEELDEIEQSTKTLITRSLIFWVMRWAIGFSIIGIIVYYNNNLSWLWWLGIAIALITPVVSLFTKVILGKKLKETQDKLKELEAMLEEDDA